MQMVIQFILPSSAICLPKNDNKVVSFSYCKLCEKKQITVCKIPEKLRILQNNTHSHICIFSI